MDRNRSGDRLSLTSPQNLQRLADAVRSAGMTPLSVALKTFSTLTDDAVLFTARLKFICPCGRALEQLVTEAYWRDGSCGRTFDWAFERMLAWIGRDLASHVEREIASGEIA